MELHYSELENGIRYIKLSGTLDTIGKDAIETEFAGHCSGDGVHVIVDLSGVDYISSIGIRLLTSNAKSVAGRGGKVVLFDPTPEVKGVLEMTGIGRIIPIFHRLDLAEAALKG
jgi:anti-anti-sigma factor